MPRTPLVALALALVLAACGQDDDPEGARVLWEKINASGGFRSWDRAPNYPTRKPSFTAHANEVEIFVSPEVATTLSTPTTKPVTTWPVGSIIVKEGYGHGSSRRLVAAMEKRADGWFWAEYDDAGTAKYSGRPAICLDCHDNRKDYSDWVYAFELPR